MAKSLEYYEGYWEGYEANRKVMFAEICRLRDAIKMLEDALTGHK